MAKYVKKEGDITLNRNKQGGEGQPTGKGTLFINGQERPLTLYRKDSVEGKQPTHYGYVDIGNDDRYTFSAWFAGEGEQINRRPNFSGRMTMGDWERPFALWQKDGKEIWWAGSVDMSEDRKKEAYGKQKSNAQSQTQQPAQQLNDGFSNQVQGSVPLQNSDSGFDLDDNIPF